MWLAAWMAPLLSILFAIAAPAASAIPVHWNRTVQSRAAATPIVPAKSGAQNAGYLNRYGWSACIGKSDAPGARQNRIATGLVLGTYVPGVSCTAYPAQYGQQTIVSVRPANSHFGRDPPVRLQPSTVYDGSTRYDGTSGFSLAAENITIAEGTANAAQYAKLKDFYRQAAKYGADSTRLLENGRYRFYGEFRPSSTLGEMAGARLVREWDSATNATRTWMETLDQAGTVRSVAPKPPIYEQNHFIFDANGKYVERR